MDAPDTLLALGIEASNPSSTPDGSGMGVALARLTLGPKGWSVAPIDREPIAPASREHDDLMPAVARLGARAGVGAPDLGLVAVSIGPGGFTAVRSATAAAVGITLAARARCAGVRTELALARRVALDGRPFAIGLASKRGGVWVRAFSARAEPQGPGRVLEAADVPALAREGGVARLVVDRFCPEPVREACAGAGIALVGPVFDAYAVIEAAVEVEWTGPEGLAPTYPREPEAVRVWREGR